MKNQSLLYKIFILVIFLFFVVVVYYYVYLQYFAKSSFLEINFLDVGQGEAAFILTPDFYKILIDGGPDLSILSKLNNYLSFFDNSIDLVVITHPDSDHITGLIDVLKRYQIGLVLFNGVKRNFVYYKELLKIIKEKNIPIFVVSKGEIIKTGDEVVFEVFSPFKNLFFKKIENSNYSSIVLKLIFNKNSFLFTADSPKELEKHLVDKIGQNLESNVLKVAHHGSKNSSSMDFLSFVKPDFSVISVGKNNRYGHPHKIVLERLKKIGSKILRTDIFGDIQIKSNGLDLKVKCELGC